MIEIGLCVESSCLVEPLIGLGALIEMCSGLLVVGSRQQNGCGWKTTKERCHFLLFLWFFHMLKKFKLQFPGHGRLKSPPTSTLKSSLFLFR